MQLTDEQFQSMVGAVSVLESQPVLDDDRRAPRLRTSGGLQMFPWGASEQRFHVQVRDLSRGGMGVLHACRANLDDAFVAELPQGDGRPAVAFLCTVAYWEPLAENLYAIGMQFQRPVTQQEIEAQRNARPTAGPGVLARIGQILQTWRVAS